MRTPIRADLLHDKILRQQQLIRCKYGLGISPDEDKELESLNKEIRIETFLARGFQVIDGGKIDELGETG